MVRINSISGLADRNISDFHHQKTIGNHISWDSTLVASLVKIGGRLPSVEGFADFLVTDRLDDRHPN